jgi:hypothetical protein
MFSFDGLPPDACPPCRKKKDAQFIAVRRMVKDHPGITALEVYERTGVPLSTISNYVESGLLEVVSTKGNLGNTELQLWIDKSTQKGKKAKEQAVEVQEETLPPENKNKKVQIHFVVK